MSADLNLINMEQAVDQFLVNYRAGICNLHRLYVADNNSISLLALIEQLKEELKTGIVSFYNKNNSLDGLDSYLFYITNSYCKRFNKLPVKNRTEYVCPGCLFLGTLTLLDTIDKLWFKCEECGEQSKLVHDPKKLHFYRTFAVHQKLGYRCSDCDRFIPHPTSNARIICCPYLDCGFVGECDDLSRMYHPTSKNNPEKLVLDNWDSNSLKNDLVSSDPNALLSLVNKQELENKIKLLQDIIFSQRGHVAYTSSDFTVKHKQLVYQAFDVLLKKFPQDIISYLLEGSRSGGFQHRIFQEYIRLLEQELPFFIRKGAKRYRVDSLLNEHLCIFDGISVFNSVITPKLEVKNETSEFYIGGRKASYAKPYYIGKLLNIVRQDNKDPILHLVKEYSFSRIRLQNIEPQTPVIVTHLRIPPHYQMGGMVYVNRVRKKIVERAQTILQKDIHA